MHEPLSAAARRDVRRPSSVTGELLRAAYLVDRDQVDEFVGLVARLQELMERQALRRIDDGTLSETRSNASGRPSWRSRGG